MNLYPLVFHCADALSRCPLNGAIFELCGPCGPLQSARSDERGLCCFDCLAPGTYSLTETYAPPGYRRTPKIYPALVTACGKTYISGIPAQQVLVVNYPEYPTPDDSDGIVRYSTPTCQQNTCL